MNGRSQYFRTDLVWWLEEYTRLNMKALETELRTFI